MKLKLNIAEKFNRPTFNGFQHKKSDKGASEYEFNLPYDNNRYKSATVEIYSVVKNKDGYYQPGEILGVKDMPINGVKVDLKKEYNLENNEPFAYRYRLVNETENKPITESGTIIFKKRENEPTDEGTGHFNLVTQLGSKVSKGGAMYLLIPDSFNAGWVFDEKGIPVLDEKLRHEALRTTKTFSNKLGGNLAGVIEKIPYLKEQGYTRIVSTPMFTDDSLSAHGYWIKNAMQMSQSLGSVNNYSKMIKEMFKADMNLVADGAFVNEGLEGIHFRDVLKRGGDSPYYNWFRAEGLKNGPLGMGVFAKNHDHISHRVINSPHKYVQDEKTGRVRIDKNANEDYNPKKPTYIQIYDDRFPSAVKDGDENPVEINTHEDIIVNYTFPINPDTYNDNIKRLSEFNKGEKEPLMLDSYEAARFLTKADKYSLEEKYEGGFETWDANNDIAKLNFGFSKADEKLMENLPQSKRDEAYEEMLAKNLEVQDYAISSGKYWTKKTNDILLGYAARKLKDVKTPEEALKTIENLIDENKLPKSLKQKINQKTIESVFNGQYQLKNKKKTTDYEELLLSGLMDLPLDSIELGDDIVAVLGYPYITNRAGKASELGASRYSLYKQDNPHLKEEYKSVYNKTTDMYKNEMLSFADDIMTRVNEKLPADTKIFDGNKSGAYGKYVIPLMSQEIAKFAVIKSLVPKENVVFNENSGEISYDYKTLKALSLNEIGIVSMDAKNDAENLVSKISHGITKISEEDKAKLADAIYKQIEGTNENSFKLSEAIIDRTQAGLDWRIDAAKDIADVQAIRNSNSDFQEIWQEATDFWKKFAKTVHRENPNSYMAAELTDVQNLHDVSGKKSRYSGSVEAERKFLEETGINTTANYSYYFTDITNIFGKSFETGNDGGDSPARNQQVKNVNNKYFNSAQLESLLFSYTFSGNHDKPRALHCLALDMSLFHSKFENLNDKVTAAKIIKNRMFINEERQTDDVSGAEKEIFIRDCQIDFDLVSPKAIAMADAVRSAMGEASAKSFGSERNEEIYKAISESISDLAQGHYLETTFEPDAFGVKPFDQVIKMVLKQAKEEYHLELSPEERKTLTNKTFEIMLKPAMSRMVSLTGFLVALPGNPTLFAGDELGLTGYEEKCKNVYLQNRSALNWEGLNEENKAFINNYKNKINDVIRLRNNPRLKALNTGAPFALESQKGNKNEEYIELSGVLRQDTDGSMVVSVFNPSGFDLNNKNGINDDYDKTVTLDKISLGGIAGGIRPGTKFYNVKNNDEYEVYQYGDSYAIRRVFEKDVYLNKDSMINSTLILTTEKHDYKQPSFTGSKVLYNPQYNFVSNPYMQVAKQSVGIKLKSSV